MYVLYGAWCCGNTIPKWVDASEANRWKLTFAGRADDVKLKISEAFPLSTDAHNSTCSNPLLATAPYDHNRGAHFQQLPVPVTQTTHLERSTPTTFVDMSFVLQ